MKLGCLPLLVIVVLFSEVGSCCSFKILCCYHTAVSSALTNFLGLSTDMLQLPRQTLLSEVHVLSVFTRALISTAKLIQCHAFQ